MHAAVTLKMGVFLIIWVKILIAASSFSLKKESVDMFVTAC